MTADLTSEDEGDAVDVITLRLSAARAEGVREGIEMVSYWLLNRAELLRARARTSDKADWRHKEQHAADHLEIARRAIRAIFPPPAEPTGGTAEPVQTDDGWIEWKGGECPVPPKTFVEVRLRFVEKDVERGPADAFDWTWQGGHPPIDIIAYRIQPAEPSAPVAPEGLDRSVWGPYYAQGHYDAWQEARKDIDALEAENAKLRERNAALEDGLRSVVSAHTWHERAPTPYVSYDGVQAENAAKAASIAGARALLQGGPDAG